MPIKVLQFALIQGMNQDISPSKRTDKFAYEIKNMRVTIEDDNTLLAWTSEKGTELIVTQLPNGKVLGSCVINDELILFVKDSTSSTPDCICGIINIDTEPEVIYYYKGNLNFQELNKIETIGVIENSKLHKVYWIDGCNQPRFINIANKETTEQGTVYGSDNTLFDFLPTDNLFEQDIIFDDESSTHIERTLKVEIEKVYQVGLFKAGTIQYAFNYYNLNGALTNLVYISPIQYISSLNRGNNVDETVNCAFKIKCLYVNKKFDYLRIYSISRASTDTTPQVRLVTDISTHNIGTEKVFIDRNLIPTTARRAPLQLDISYLLKYSKEEKEADKQYSFQLKQIENSVKGNIYRNIKEGPIEGNTFVQVKFEQLDDLRDFIAGVDYDVYEMNPKDYLVWGNYVYYTDVKARLRITRKEENNYPGYYTYTIDSFVDTGVSPASGDIAIHRRAFISVEEISSLPLVGPNTGVIEAPVIEFTDNGTLGSIFDYNALLFMNNNSIIPNTMDLKDNVLFIGNYKYTENDDFELKQAIEASDIKANDLIKFVNVQVTVDYANLYYPYTNQNVFSADKIMGFKGGEQYIFGFMVQNMQDKWSSIIAFKDIVTNTLYPKVEESLQSESEINEDKRYTTYIVQAVLNDDAEETISPYKKLINIINSKGQYKAIKFVIVSKNTAQRNVICQGVLCPTVFCQENRIKHQLPFAQSSWFFRPTMRHNPSHYETSDSSKVPEFRHYNLIGGEILSSGEILTEKELGKNAGCVPDYFEYTAGYTAPISYDRVAKDVDENSDYYGNTRFGVDNQILTMHSPDIEFDSNVQNILDDNDVLKFRIIGYTKVHSTYSDADISLKRKSFFYEKVTGDKSTAMTGRIITGQDKLINIYNQKYPAAGLSAYNGLFGDTYYNYSYTDEDGNSHTDEGEITNAYYKIYPWHRSTTLNAQPTPSIQVTYDNKDFGTDTVIDDSYWQIPLEHKEISNVRVCCKTRLGQDYIWRPLTKIEEDPDKRGIGNIYVWYPTDKVTKIKDVTYPWDNQITYEGNIDTVLNVSPKRCYWLEYFSKRGGSHTLSQIGGHLRSNDLIRMKYKSSAHAVFNLCFNRYKSLDGKDYYQLWILPSIKNGDATINTLWAGYQTVSWDTPGKEGTDRKTFDFKNINCYNGVEDSQFELLFLPGRSHHRDEDELYNYSSDLLKEVANYCKNKMPNFVYEDGQSEYYLFVIYRRYQRRTEDGSEQYVGIIIHHIPYNRDRRIGEEYKVENHILYVGNCFKDKDNNGYVVLYINSTTGLTTVKKVDISEDTEQSQEDDITAGNDLYTVKDYNIDAEDDGIFYIGELYQDSKLSVTEHELENYSWLAASNSISLNEVKLPNLYGDTYFQRYDCLKTYSAGPDDPNQIVDIGSFMLETRINMDGRYDRNRGLLSNLNITDTNFNLINKAYTQNDYFVNTYINNSNLDVSEYPNTVTWSLTKVYGEPIDNWTHLTNTSNLDLDGERGTLTKIVNFQDVLLFFLTEGAGIIKYNENVALAATNELPVELANSGKVDGKLYLNRIIGCLNKDTIVVTKNALYFIDGNTNSIYLMTLALSLANPLSITENSFENFMKSQDISTAKGFYNKDKQEVYYIFDNEEAPCIAYSENTKQFTSFYDYKPSFFECIGETAYHILNSELNTFSIWALNKGDYNRFYGTYKPFYITVSANGEDGVVDKIWNNVEFRADTYNDDNELLSNTTFDELNVWNEHQVGTAKLTLYGNNGSINSPSNLKKKFRIWRTNIPRSQYMAYPKFNKGINVTIENSIFKNQIDLGRGRNRIRNPWTYILLKNSNPDAYKTTLHDLMVYYFE